MKLDTVRIANFQSVQDSNEFKVDDITCLVGKNEAGKTALLKALYRLNPVIEEDGNFDYEMDYPRQNMIDYENAVEAEDQEHEPVVQAVFVIDDTDITVLEEDIGISWNEHNLSAITLKIGYDNERTITYSYNNGEPPYICSFESDFEVDPDDLEDGGLDTFAVLRDRIPKFLYFDEYHLMSGQDNFAALKSRHESGNLEPSDLPLLGLIQLAGLDFDRLERTTRTESLFARIEAASNKLTEKALPYWSQNEHLRMKFDIREAKPDDPENMRSGLNIWGRVEDTKHMVTTPIRSRSRGFVWFFSFLAWYSKLCQDHENLILLLDEPGLFLHAKGQADLLNFFDKELNPHHQLIYTTHSPFMVDSRHFDRVRIVQNLSIERNSNRLAAKNQGTKVLTEVLEAKPDSLFPLQGALGYEIFQTLFVGPNSLVVEGVSDLLYIQTISALLQLKGKSGLSKKWTVTPVGGSDKIPTFVALLGSQKGIKVAVLIDYQMKDQQKIEALFKKKLLKDNMVFTYADYVTGKEADIEDLFDPELYLELINAEFGTCLAVNNLPKCSSRIIKRVEQYFENSPLPDGQTFNHYRPARYFSVNIDSLESKLAGSQLERFQKVFDELNRLL